MQHETGPRPIVSEALSDTGRIRHGYFTRQGGVSEGLYRGLNVGIGSADSREHVAENRARVAGWFGAPTENLVTLYQVHSPDVVTLDGIEDLRRYGERPKADALVTKRPGLVLGVLSADCGPILFADRQAGVVGAAHAGWKGALTGVLENTVEAMVGLGAERERIVAVLGPSIGRDSYEVGPEFVERFLAHDPSYEAYFSPSPKDGHAMFDLPGLTVRRLQQAGVQAGQLGLCTYADADRFFSYRRTTHAREPDYGRQISAIAIMED